VHGNDLAAGMSSYLADRILAHASITVRTAAKVTALHGGSHLEAITVYTAARATTNPTATSHVGACPALQRHHRHRLARGHRCR
jgi:thioredoxin reductase (NADPH)